MRHYLVDQDPFPAGHQAVRSHLACRQAMVACQVDPWPALARVPIRVPCQVVPWCPWVLVVQGRTRVDPCQAAQVE